MWYLERIPTSEGQHSGKYWLGGPQGGGRTVGRKDVDIRVKVPSASRLHARFDVAEGLHEVLVTDTSAYGTFLAKNSQELTHHERLPKKQASPMQDDAAVAFGTPSTWLRLRRERIAVGFQSGSLQSEAEQRVRRLAQETGMSLQENWTSRDQDVTHVLADVVGADDADLVLAVVRGIQVVLPTWVTALHTMVTQSCHEITHAPNAAIAVERTSIPLPNAFKPELSRNLACFVGNKKLDLITRRDRTNLLESWCIQETADQTIDEIIRACGGLVARKSQKRDPTRSFLMLGHDEDSPCPFARFFVAVLACDVGLLPVLDEEVSSGTVTPPPDLLHPTISAIVEPDSDAETDGEQIDYSSTKVKPDSLPQQGSSSKELVDQKDGRKGPPSLQPGSRDGFFKRRKQNVNDSLFSIEGDESLIISRPDPDLLKHRATGRSRDVRPWGKKVKESRVYLSGVADYD